MFQEKIWVVADELCGFTTLKFRGINHCKPYASRCTLAVYKISHRLRRCLRRLRGFETRSNDLRNLRSNKRDLRENKLANRRSAASLFFLLFSFILLASRSETE